MSEKEKSYLSPRLEARALPEKGAFGVFAREFVARGELLVMWTGVLVDLDNLREMPPDIQSHSIQVEENLYLASVPVEKADYINHSCNPNAGLRGQIALVAMRDILPGEEICYDYAMSDGSVYDEFTCQCGEAICRGQVTGDDWRLPELQARYRGYFSAYLQRRIDMLEA